jgi:hypothetical protein
VPGKNRPSSGESDDEPKYDRVAPLVLIREDEEDGGAGIAIVSDISPLGFGVSTDPHEPQKRLLSNISVEQDGHLIMRHTH